MEETDSLPASTSTFTAGKAVMAPETSFMVFGNFVEKRIFVKCLFYDQFHYTYFGV
jgi:hypothetical protein